MIATMPAVPRSRPSLAVLIGVAGLVFAVLITGAVVAERREPSPATRVSQRDLHAALAYADAIEPATRLAGQAIVLGIRADIPDFRSGRISAEVWKTDMEARSTEFARAREVFRSTAAPKIVDDAPQAFDQAFKTYLRAVRILLQAGDVVGAERERLISLGAATGDAGDKLFDRGAAAIQRVRRAAGLESDIRFPDKEQHR